MPNQDAVQLLYDNLGQLNSPEGPITLLPFAYDCEETRHVKRQVCEALVTLLEDNGYIAPPAATEPAAPSRRQQIQLRCRTCAELLMSTTVDESGVGMIHAPTLIEGMARKTPACPHTDITPADNVRRIEEAILATQQSEGGQPS